MTEDSVTTELQLEQSYERFRAMDNLRDRTRVYNPWIAVGTHYHFRDAYKRLENQGGWLVWKLAAHTGSPKAIFDLVGLEDRSAEGRRKIEVGIRRIEANPPGELGFPKILPWRELYRSARAEGPQQYNCQLLLNPLPESDQRFDRDALVGSWSDEIPGSSDMWMYVRCDPAISVKRTADETAIILGGVKWDASRWICDGWIGREKRPTEIVRKLFALAVKWQKRGYRVQNIGIESVAYQEALSAIARGGVPERDGAEHGESVPVLRAPCPIRSIHRSPDMRKQERILEMDGPVSRREVRFWKGWPGAAKVMGQFQNFPFDRFDALDAVHDFWIGTATPPRSMQSDRPVLHKEISRILDLADAAKRPVLRGTSGSVKLAAWGN